MENGSFEELERHLSENRLQVEGLCQSIFGTRAPVPSLHIGPLSDISELDFHTLRGLRYAGYYVEERRLIAVDPTAIQQHCVQSGADILINPKSEMLRVFAKEYGQHLYSSLHDWSIMSSIDYENPRRIFIAASLTEAIGVTTMLKVAERLKQTDDYQKSLDLTLSQLSEEAQSSSFPDSVLFAINGFGYYWGMHWLYRQSDSEFRDFVRRGLKDVWDLADETAGAYQASIKH